MSSTIRVWLTEYGKHTDFPSAQFVVNARGDLSVYSVYVPPRPSGVLGFLLPPPLPRRWLTAVYAAGTWKYVFTVDGRDG